MKISTKGRYGLRAMVDLAIHSLEGHVALNSIAERQNISANYLEQVFSTLRKAGLVKSIKGAQGGYILGKAAPAISVGEILRTLEGELLSFNDSDDTPDSNPVEFCIKSRVWEKMMQSLNDVVDNLTLEDLVLDYQHLNKNQAYMLYI